MGLKSLIFATLLAYATSALAEQPSFGFVEFQGEKIYLHAPNARSSIRNATLQYPDENNKPTCCLLVTKKDLLRAEGSLTVEPVDAHDAKKVIRYEIRQRTPANATYFIGMALINVHGRVQSNAKLMTAKADGGAVLAIEKCLATEGVNLTTTARLPVKHLYYALGYGIDLNDVKGEPICDGAVSER